MSASDGDVTDQEHVNFLDFVFLHQAPWNDYRDTVSRRKKVVRYSVSVLVPSGSEGKIRLPIRSRVEIVLLPQLET